MAGKVEGYLHCTNKECERRGIKTYLYSRVEVEAFFSKDSHLPKCPNCGIGLALWDRDTQEAFDQVFYI